MAPQLWESRRISIIDLAVQSQKHDLNAGGFLVMTRIFLLFLTALICAPAALAQDRDYSHYEFYVGYAHERANNDAGRFDKNGTATCNGLPVNFRSEKADYNGFEVEFNQNVTLHIGIVEQLTGTYDKTDYFDQRSGRTFRASVQRYDLLAGPRFNWRPRGVTPFAEALFGISHLRADFDNAITPQVKSDTAFAMAFGGGVDVNAGDHLDVRVLQLDYVPTFFNGKRQDGIRASAGIKIK
jgi:opacity protein-like surface antigen